MFRRYWSVDVTPGITPANVLLRCAQMANIGTVPHSLVFLPTAALLLTALQASTDRSQNALVETRNKLVETRNRLGTFLFLPSSTSKLAQ